MADPKEIGKFVCRVVYDSATPRFSTSLSGIVSEWASDKNGVRNSGVKPDGPAGADVLGAICPQIGRFRTGRRIRDFFRKFGRIGFQDSGDNFKEGYTTFQPETGSQMRGSRQAGRGGGFGVDLLANPPISGRPADSRFPGEEFLCLHDDWFPSSLGCGAAMITGSLVGYTGVWDQRGRIKKMLTRAREHPPPPLF